MPSEAQHLVNLTAWANLIFQPVRDYFKCPIYTSSVYRSPLLNEKIGGSSTSFHCEGKAGDLDQDDRGNGVDNVDVFEFIYKNLDYTELIFEFPYIDGDTVKCSWVHAAIDVKSRLEKKTLIAHKIGKETVYTPYSEKALIEIIKS